MRVNVELPQAEIVAFCQRHHITKQRQFGSILRDDFDPESDIDILVEFEAGHVPGLSFFAMQDELSELLGRKVDLHTPQFLSPYFREQVQTDAQVQYAAR